MSLSSNILDLKTSTARLVDQVVAPRADEVDRDCLWPEHSMQAFAAAGLLGLHVPQELGGHGEGLLALCLMTEVIAKECPSSALCFGMHCVGTAVIAAKATGYHRDKYLRPIAAGRHITTLALSETGSGAHFYLPETKFQPDGDCFIVSGTKQFVTNGGRADSYVLSGVVSNNAHEFGDFSCLVVDGETQGLEWLAPWQGFGMRGNSSRGLRLDGVAVPSGQLLGELGDQVWYVFEVVAPYFLMAMAGTYLGVAQAALDHSRQYLDSRRYNHSGALLAESDVIQTRLAEMWMQVEQARSLLYEAARRGDCGDPEALPFILASKASAAQTAVSLANEAMTICGGTAYRANSRVAQILRDARAGHVMSPTTDLLKLWTGRALLELPLL